MNDFEERNKTFIEKMSADDKIQKVSQEWFNNCLEHEYHYHFSWLGVPIIQFPEDIVVMQELVWAVKPDLIIETGVARGGSVLFYASMLQLIGHGEVVGIDIDIRKPNREAIENHPMAHRVSLIESSSVENETLEKVKEYMKGKKKILVVLDSNHTHEHVLKELKLYSPLVSKGSYVVVFDTAIEDIPEKFNQNRPWNNLNNPRTAVREFLADNKDFIVDKSVENKMLVTVARHGFLKRV